MVTSRDDQISFEILISHLLWLQEIFDKESLSNIFCGYSSLVVTLYQISLVITHNSSLVVLLIKYLCGYSSTHLLWYPYQISFDKDHNSSLVSTLYQISLWSTHLSSLVSILIKYICGYSSTHLLWYSLSNIFVE